MANRFANYIPDWSAEQEAFIEWLALPKSERVPKTEIALAAQLGVDRTTLYKWRNLPALSKEVQKLCRSLVGSRLPDVLAAVERSALAGSIAHQRLYFELLNMIGPGKEKPIPLGGGIKVLAGVDLDLVGRAYVKPPATPKPDF
jgi:hypothetical protein